MKKIQIIAFMVLAGIMGCDAEKVSMAEPETIASKPAQEKYSTRVYCKDPRPQMCTREYMPVCAEPMHKTYATGCTACADTKVSSYVRGKCE